MSFIDGIFNGISGAVKGVFGIDDGPDRSSDGAGSVGARTGKVASKVSTKFEPSPAPSERDAAVGGAFAGFSLVDHIRANAQARNTTPDPGPPSVGATSGGGTASMDSSRLDAAIAQVEAERQAAQAQQPAEPVAEPAPAPRARVFDWDSGAELGTVDTLGSGNAGVAARNVQAGLDYLGETFGRSGLDGAGSGVDVLIGDRSTDEDGTERFRGNGGYYSMPDRHTGEMREAIHFGTGTHYDAAQGLVDQQSMLHADDLAIHELFHGVIRSQYGVLGGEADEAGATNEAIADVMAASATRDWHIGEKMYTDESDYRLMRNIAQPDDPTAIHGLWTTMDQVREKVASGEELEEHWASGVVSHAAYQMQQRFAGDDGWQVVEQVFYGAIQDGQLGDMSFGSVASALRASADRRYGVGSSVSQVVDEELRRAGL